MTAPTSTGGLQTLSVSVVTYCSDEDWLAKTLQSLGRAVNSARSAGVLDSACLLCVDNGADRTPAPSLHELLSSAELAAFARVEEIPAPANLGYGAGHNLAIRRAASEYHLVLNPDVILDVDALLEGLTALQAENDVAAVGPAAVDEHARPTRLCKAFPTVIDLALRGVAPKWLKQKAQGRLQRYEMVHLDYDVAARRAVPLLSGCCLLVRTAMLQRVGGFDPGFFMYFEDFDLSIRLRNLGRLVFVPGMRIVHAGGGAAGKGFRHTYMFVRSACRFFRLHGWRWW